MADATLIPLPSFVNSRIARYKNAIEVVKNAVQNNIIDVKAERFLKTQSPTEAQIDAIVTEIIQNKKTLQIKFCWDIPMLQIMDL